MVTWTEQQVLDHMARREKDRAERLFEPDPKAAERETGHGGLHEALRCIAAIETGPIVRRLVPEPDFNLRQSTVEQALNQTEKAFICHLRRVNVPGLQIQAVTFTLGHDLRFTPDVSWLDPNGRWTFADVKGTRSDGKMLRWEDAQIKAKIAARLFPWLRFVTAWRPDKVNWEIQDVKP
jgi:hypothetical protein